MALTTPGGQLMDSVAQIYGLEVARNMLEIKDRGWPGGSATASPLVTGMIGSPAISRSHRGYLSLFVNRRWVSSRLLARAVEEAYHGLLMQGKHPIAVINISLPPEEVDVNIHPTKIEVKFQDERTVFTAVQRAVRQALIELAPVPKIEEVVTTYVSPLPPGQASWTSVTGGDGLYLIDQHAAHERILFEKIKRQQSQREVEVQGLLEPVTFEVNPKQDEVLKSNYEKLADFGFSIEPFGDRTYLVRTVPVMLHDKDWAGMVRELLDSLSGGDKDDWVEKIAVSIACHGAVRAGQVLTNDEMRELVRQLEQVDIPHTCPHGRPTTVHLSSAQLKREFGRS
ncbi:DNA mismatch repair protein MutL [subsurface metagenome]